MVPVLVWGLGRGASSDCTPHFMAVTPLLPLAKEAISGLVFPSLLSPLL